MTQSLSGEVPDPVEPDEESDPLPEAQDQPSALDLGSTTPPPVAETPRPRPLQLGTPLPLDLADLGRTTPPPFDLGRTTPPPLDLGRTTPPPLDLGRTTPPPLDLSRTTPPPLDMARTTPPPPEDVRTTAHIPPPGRVGPADPGQTPDTLPPAGSAAPRTPPPLPQGSSWQAKHLVGCLLGDWVIERALGEGAWGAVFLAHASGERSKRVALKVPKALGSSQAMARFRVEVQTIRRIHEALGSRHIIGFRGADPQARPYPWLALEYVEGTDLGAELKRRRKFPVREAIRFALNILNGLEDAHRLGIVHRDLKPDNVLMSLEGDIRLADFGVARAVRRGLGEQHASGITITGQHVGTPYYMPPEQIDGVADLPGDLYSFGAMLYTMIAGRPPFRGNLMAVIHGHTTRQAAPVSDFAIGVPPELDALVARLLAKLPAERPRVAECRAELKRVLQLLDQPREETAKHQVAALELEPGDEVGEYVIDREVGRGGMGVVYAAHDQRGDPYALKVAGLAFSSQEQARRQLMRDAQHAIEVSQTSRHVAVARVYEVCEEVVRGVSLVFLVSELVDGPSLGEFIAERGPLDERQALRLWIAVAEGLAAIHDAGVLHLDMAPGNVLLARDPNPELEDEERLARAQPKIVDFGISKRVESLTIRVVEGNPGYMSPEQCDGHKPSKASDVYMLGACFYHATTGRPVFSGEPLAIMNQHRRVLPQTPDLEDAALGPDLALVIHRCLFKEPEQRYADVGELLADLRRVGKGDFPRGQLKQAWAREQREHRDAPVKVGRLVGAVVATALLVVIAVGSYLQDRSAQELRESQAAAAVELAQRVYEAQRAKIEGAPEKQLGALPGELDQLGVLSPEQRAELRRALARRAGSLLQSLREQVVAARAGVVADPGPTIGTLGVLKAGSLDDLLDFAGTAPAWLTPLLPQLEAGTRPSYPERVAPVAREVELLLELCRISLILDKQEWDRGAAELATLTAEPAQLTGAGDPTLEAVQGKLQAGVATLVAALDAVEAQVRAQLEASRFRAAEDLLRGFQSAHPSSEQHQAAALRQAALVVAIADARKAGRFDALAEDEQAILSARLPPLDEDPLQVALLCDEFLNRVVEGRAGAFRDTPAGQEVVALRARARALRGDQARAAWEALEDELAEPWSAAARAADFDRLRAAYQEFPSAWERAGEHLILIAVEGRDGAGPGDELPLGELRARALRRVATARERRLDALVELAWEALRAHDLGAGAVHCAQAEGFPEATDGPRGETLRLRRAELELLRRLDAALVTASIPADYTVGRDGDALNGTRPIEARGTLRVDPHETTVETYALFLRVVQAAGAEHPRLLGCHPDEPPTSHLPVDWPEQARHPQRPVTGVSWFDAYACARWAGRRLLAADEWEFAARGHGREAHRLDDREDPVWQPASAPRDVGAGADESDLSIRDTQENVSEWTATRGPPLAGGATYVYCGANYLTLPAVAFHALYRRNYGAPAKRKPYLGFRCALR